MKKNIVIISFVFALIVLIFSTSYTINSNGKKIRIGGTTYAITIDGTESNNIPLNGNYYLDSYECTNGSIITWDYFEHDLYIEKIKTNTESCQLNFKSGNLPLAKMKVGDYVAYSGDPSNGCLLGASGTEGTGEAESGNSCLGYNANQPSNGTADTKGNYGYCYNDDRHYTTYGWRIAYIEDDKAYLISAGSPECVARLHEEKPTGPFPVDSIKLYSYSSYYFGTDYIYDSLSGTFTLSGTKTKGKWSSIYSDVIDTYKYTCKSSSETATCKTLNEITGYVDDTSASGNAYYNMAAENSTHISLMNAKALKYCNPIYVDGGICPTTVSEENVVRALGNTDFEKITYAISGISSSLTSLYGATSCVERYTYKRCGSKSDLLLNGGNYWFAAHNNNEGVRFGTTVFTSNDESPYGLRPIIRLSSSVYVTGGSGTMDDPYTIGI